ncbi:hypothetical protein THAOC_13013 [Thalassiosira oceanica]|uniref:Uncharacterized protein n=2 Tax=Thalassiosira oceanica TaxID=159749 RepID=K0T6L7_THAOC|nr:hypothetical protein THAOC_13013 [Thalassiosira oceanica]|eukprot:EJK66082.1 hypothetical protein THAOC_13013 [Thalassiosira oceanica]
MGNTSSYRAAASPAASASSATAMVESPSKTRPTSISGGSPLDAETQSASPATAMVESPSKTRPTPISGGSSPRHSFFPRTDAEVRSSPRRVIVGTPSARGLEADAEQRPPSPTGYKLKRVTVGGEEYLPETPAVLLADSPQKKRKPRQDGITRCACGNPECDELSGRLQAAGVRVSYHRLPSEPQKRETAGAKDRSRRRARTLAALGCGAKDRATSKEYAVSTKQEFSSIHCHPDMIDLFPIDKSGNRSLPKKIPRALGLKLSNMGCVFTQSDKFDGGYFALPNFPVSKARAYVEEEERKKAQQDHMDQKLEALPRITPATTRSGAAFYNPANDVTNLKDQLDDLRVQLNERQAALEEKEKRLEEEEKRLSELMSIWEENQVSDGMIYSSMFFQSDEIPAHIAVASPYRRVPIVLPSCPHCTELDPEHPSPPATR